MKRICAVIAVLFMCGVLMPGALSAAPAPPVVSVCGESATGNQAEALDDAKMKAVRRVLAKMIIPNMESDSIFQKILNRYKEFAGEPKVTEKRNEGGTLYLISRVEVDAYRLHEAVQEATQKEQTKESDSVACFLIRTQGLPSGKGWAIVHEAYNDSFEHIGFDVETADELSGEIEARQNDDYERFCQAIIGKVKSDYPEITMAVIGEIVAVTKQNDATGALVHTDVRIRAIDIIDDKMIAEFTDAYEMKRNDLDEAQQVAMYKSAWNSAAALADKTLSYWQKKRGKQ